MNKDFDVILCAFFLGNVDAVGTEPRRGSSRWRTWWYCIGRDGQSQRILSVDDVAIDRPFPLEPRRAPGQSSSARSPPLLRCRQTTATSFHLLVHDQSRRFGTQQFGRTVRPSHPGLTRPSFSFLEDEKKEKRRMICRLRIGGTGKWRRIDGRAQKEEARLRSRVVLFFPPSFPLTDNVILPPTLQQKSR